MGSYSSIMHPEDGRELQFKTGNDTCTVFKIGDKVPFSYEKDYPGMAYFQDGIYHTHSNKGNDDWVVIKDGHIAAIEPFISDENSPNYEEQRSMLWEKYNIKEIRHLWTKEQWRKQEEDLQKRLEESEDRIRKTYPDFDTKTESEKMMIRMCDVLSSTRLNYAEIGRKIIQI
jgi:hypothetical protein